MVFRKQEDNKNLFYFCNVKRCLNIVVMIWLATACFSLRIQAQEQQHISGYLVPMCVYEGDTIPCVQLRTVYLPPAEIQERQAAPGVQPASAKCEKGISHLQGN